MLTLEAVQATLAGPSCRRWTLAAVRQSVAKALNAEAAEEGFREETRGRPGPEIRYRKTEKTTFRLRFEIGADKVAYDAVTDGCLPLISNGRALSDAELLGAYRYQPDLKKRRPCGASRPLFACLALLCCCLIVKRTARRDDTGGNRRPAALPRTAPAPPRPPRAYSTTSPTSRTTISEPRIPTHPEVPAPAHCAPTATPRPSRSPRVLY